jgi:hypothetical protein
MFKEHDPVYIALAAAGPEMWELLRRAVEHDKGWRTDAEAFFDRMKAEARERENYVSTNNR